MYFLKFSVTENLNMMTRSLKEFFLISHSHTVPGTQHMLIVDKSEVDFIF